MTSILDMMRDVATPEVVQRASAVVGETPSATRQAFGSAASSILAGLVGKASTPAGAERLHATLADGGYGADLLGSLPRLLDGGHATDTLSSTGGRLVSDLFGASADSVADAVARGGVVRQSSASVLLRLAAPIVMSVLGKQVASRGLGPAGLVDLLMGQRSAILDAAPAGLASRLGLQAPTTAVAEPPGARVASHGLAHDVRDVPDPDVPPSPWSLSRLWPALLAGLAGLALLAFLTRDREPPVAGRAQDTPAASVRQPVTLELPSGQRLGVTPGGFLQQLGTYLGDASGEPPPKRFVFDDLTFESATTRLTPQSQGTVSALITILTAYPSAQVRLEGHTDASGDPAANKQLSMDRAEAIKRMLVDGGVAADRIAVDGHGQDRPVASNDTDAGRARNRRIELVVARR
jgi:outer membrane protein OmpA-like peptidoglycan-associated protein